MVVVQQSANASAPSNSELRPRWRRLSRCQLVVEPLVVSLVVVVLEVLIDNEPQMAFAEHDYPVQTFLLDRFGLLGGNLNDSTPPLFKISPNLLVNHAVPVDLVPEVESAPRILVYPQPGFATAILTTSPAISHGVLGRPRPLRALPPHFFAISWRYQRRIVSGVTMPAMARSALRPSLLPRTASRLRWASLRRSGRSPSCSRRIRFSSLR